MSSRRVLTPNQKFSRLVALLAVLVVGEIGGLVVLSNRHATSEAAPPPLTPSGVTNPVPTKPTPASLTPPGDVYVAPGVNPSPGAPVTGATAPGTSVLPGILAPAAISKGGGANAITGDSPQKSQARAAFGAGLAALERKDAASATREFERVVSLLPTHLPSHLNLALLYSEAKQPQKAVVHLQKAAQIDKRSAKVRFDLARTLLQLRRPNEAIAPLREMVHLAPKEREGRALLARVYGETKRYKDAYASWETLADADARDLEAHLMAATLANDFLRQPQSAEKWLRRAVQGSPRAPQPALLLGRLLMAKKRPKEAASILTAATRARPDVFELYSMLATARGAAGDATGAANAIQSAILRLPVGKTADEKARVEFAEGGFRISLGQTLGNAKKHREALAQFQRAAKLRPRDPLPCSLAGVASIQLKDGASATKWFQNALQREPKRTGDRKILARLYSDAKRWKDADAQLALYTRAQPRDTEALLMWAQVAHNAKDGKREMQVVRQITQIAPKNPVAWARLALLERQMGDAKAALSTYTELAALLPNDAGPPFEMARLQTQLRRFDAAFGSWQKIVRLKPDAAPLYSSLLQAGDEANRRSAARTFLVRQISGRAENVQVLKEVVAFYEAKKRPTEAKALLSDIVARNPKAKIAKALLEAYQPQKPTPTKTAAPKADETPSEVPRIEGTPPEKDEPAP